MAECIVCYIILYIIRCVYCVFQRFSNEAKNGEDMRKGLETLKFQALFLELMAGFEPATSSLPRMRSTY